jgi:putative flippase GtrA
MADSVPGLQSGLSLVLVMTAAGTIAHRVAGRRFFRFAVVGASGTVVVLGLTYILTDIIGLWYPVSYAIGFIASVANNYYLNSIWTFRGQKAYNLGFVRFLTVCGITWVLNETVVIILTEVAGLWYLASAAIGIASGFVTNYVLSLRFVWHRQQGSKPRIGRAA